MNYQQVEHIASQQLRAFWAIGCSSLFLTFIFFLEILYRGLPRPTFLYGITTAVSFALMLSCWLLPYARLSELLLHSRFKLRLTSICTFILSPFWFWALQYGNESFFTLGIIAYLIFFIAIQRELCTFLLFFSNSGSFKNICYSLLKSIYFILMVLLIICMLQTFFSPNFFKYFYATISHEMISMLLVLPFFTAIFLFTLPFESVLKRLTQIKSPEKHISP